MVLTFKKESKKQNIPLIVKNNTLLEYKPLKSRQQIYSENYQKNKERKKAQRKLRYQQQKEAQRNELAQITKLIILSPFTI